MRAWRWLGWIAWGWLALASAVHAQPEVSLEAAGVVTDPTPPPPRSDEAAIAWNGSELLVVWRSPCCAERLFARRLDASGAAISATFDFPVPFYFTIESVHPFGERWLIVGRSGITQLSALVIDDEGRTEPLPDFDLLLPPYEVTTAELDDSVFITTFGGGCVVTTELRPRAPTRTYTVDVGCRTEGSLRSVVSEGRLFVTASTALYEIVPGSGVLARRAAGDSEVIALNEGAFVRARSTGVSGGYAVVVDGIGAAPFETSPILESPRVVGLWRTPSGWLLLYSRSATIAPAVYFAELDEVGALVREDFLGWGLRPIDGGDRVFLIGPEGSLAILPHGGMVFRLAAPSPLPAPSRWLHGIATPDGAWLLLSEERALEVVTFSVDGALTHRGRLSPSDAVNAVFALPYSRGIVALEEREGALRAGASIGRTRAPVLTFEWPSRQALVDAAVLDGTAHVLLYPAATSVPTLQAIDDLGRPDGPALPLDLPYGGSGLRIVDCGASRAVFERETVDAEIVGRALGPSGVLERWTIGTGARDFAATRDPGTQAIAWVDAGDILFVTLLDAQCRPRETRRLATLGGLSRIGVATHGDVAVAVYAEVEGGPLEAVFSSPSGVTAPIEIAEGTRDIWSGALVTPLPDGGYLFWWADQRPEDYDVQARFRQARVMDTMVADAGPVDGGPSDRGDAGSFGGDVDALGDAGAPTATSGCGCSAGRRDPPRWSWLLLALLGWRRR